MPQDKVNHGGSKHNTALPDRLLEVISSIRAAGDSECVKRSLAVLGDLRKRVLGAISAREFSGMENDSLRHHKNTEDLLGAAKLTKSRMAEFAGCPPRTLHEARERRRELEVKLQDAMKQKAEYLGELAELSAATLREARAGMNMFVLKEDADFLTPFNDLEAESLGVSRTSDSTFGVPISVTTSMFETLLLRAIDSLIDLQSKREASPCEVLELEGYACSIIKALALVGKYVQSEGTLLNSLLTKSKELKNVEASLETSTGDLRRLKRSLRKSNGLLVSISAKVRSLCESNPLYAETVRSVYENQTAVVSRSEPGSVSKLAQSASRPMLEISTNEEEDDIMIEDLAEFGLDASELDDLRVESFSDPSTPSSSSMSPRSVSSSSSLGSSPTTPTGQTQQARGSISVGRPSVSGQANSPRRSSVTQGFGGVPVPVVSDQSVVPRKLIRVVQWLRTRRTALLAETEKCKEQSSETRRAHLKSLSSEKELHRAMRQISKDVTALHSKMLSEINKGVVLAQVVTPGDFVLSSKPAPVVQLQSSQGSASSAAPAGPVIPTVLTSENILVDRNDLIRLAASVIESQNKLRLSRNEYKSRVKCRSSLVSDKSRKTTNLLQVQQEVTKLQTLRFGREVDPEIFDESVDTEYLGDPQSPAARSKSLRSESIKIVKLKKRLAEQEKRLQAEVDVKASQIPVIEKQLAAAQAEGTRLLQVLKGLLTSAEQARAKGEEVQTKGARMLNELAA